MPWDGRSIWDDAWYRYPLGNANWCGLSKELTPKLMVSWTNWLSTYHGNWTLYAVELTSIDTWMFNTNFLAEILVFIVAQKSSLIFLLMLLPVHRNNMGASPDQWDNRMVDHLKNFDLSSPEVRQQFGEWIECFLHNLGFVWNTWIPQNSPCYVIHLFLPAIHYGCCHSLLQICSSDVRLPEANILRFENLVFLEYPCYFLMLKPSIVSTCF